LALIAAMNEKIGAPRRQLMMLHDFDLLERE
jgi:hypothetical protein